jgi:site-specific DNA-cytosine methylase
VLSTKALEATIHVAGTPCTDFSSRGTQNGVMGKSFVFFLAWIGMRIMLQESVVIQENVTQFCTDTLMSLLGHLYCFQIVELCPTQLGWPVARMRRWTVMRHKYKTGAFKMPLTIFTKLFYKPLLFGMNIASTIPAWFCFFVASAAELLEEFEWASNRPESAYDGDGTFTAMTGPFGTFWQVLTDCEKNFLSIYRSTWPGVLHSLNQNPLISPTHSTSSHVHTVIKNAGIIWPLVCNINTYVILGIMPYVFYVRSQIDTKPNHLDKQNPLPVRSDFHHRWLMAREALLVQGFPISTELSLGQPVCSFAMPGRDSIYVTGRTATIGQAGNAMHTEVCGVILGYAITQITYARRSLPSNLERLLD